MKLLFLQFNNYFNRIVKINDYETTSDYKANINKYHEVSGINLAIKDGITTDIYMNWPNSWEPDYVVCAADSDNLIKSSWFITDWNLERSGQYHIKLRRDLVKDYYDKVFELPMYVEKASIKPNDIAIYNMEGNKYNEIKTSETLLKDLGNVPWIVGYFSKDEDLTVNVPNVAVSVATFDTIEETEMYTYHTNPYKVIVDEKLEMWYNIVMPGSLLYKPFFKHNVMFGSYELKDGIGQEEGGDYKITLTGKTSQEDSKASAINSFLSTYDSEFINKYNTEYSYHTENEYQSEFAKYDNKLIYISTGTDDYPAGYYRVSVSRQQTTSDLWQTSSEATTYFNGLLTEAGWNVAKRSIASSYESNHIKATFNNYTFSFTLESSAAYTFTLPVSANRLIRAPYKMFAIPAGRRHVVKGQDDFTNVPMDTALNIAASIAKSLTQEQCYDLQLLPYCPIPDINLVSGLYLNELEEDKDYTIVNYNNQPQCVILYPKTDNFTFDIYNLPSISEGTTTIEKKVIKQCDKYRIASPNYAAYFDFNPVDTGTITEFNVDCTYKPGTPYIHINPVWSKLYGRDYDDPRGLIVRGDFSIPYASDKWAEYLIQNKNYQRIFDRETESIELANRLGHTSDLVGAITGAVSGAGMGAMAGSRIGGNGAAKGAIIGGTVSLIGGLADAAINETLRKDQLEARKEIWSMNLENIQALPQTLTSVSSYDYNNKIFPVLEYYTATDTEKDTFKNNLMYNGMFVGRIDNFTNFITKANGASDYQYFKGQVLRCLTNDISINVLTAINDELMTGIYI